MTLALSLEDTLPLPLALDLGYSDEAKAVRAMAADAADFTSSIYIGEHRRQALAALETAFAHAHFEGWDGSDAAPVELSTFAYASYFLNALPTTIPAPDVQVDSDGDLSFEWDCGPRRVFSVSIGRDGTLNYAGLIGHAAFHGLEQLRQGIPLAIALGIRRVTGDDINS